MDGWPINTKCECSKNYAMHQVCNNFSSQHVYNIVSYILGLDNNRNQELMSVAKHRVASQHS